MTPKEIAEKIEQAMEGTYEGPWNVEPFTRDMAEWGWIMSDGGTLVAEICGRLDSCGNGENASYIAACNPANMSALLADYKRQSKLLEEARKLADMAIDCITTDVTMQGPRVTGVNGSASRRASEMARSLLAKLEPQP